MTSIRFLKMDDLGAQRQRPAHAGALTAILVSDRTREREELYFHKREGRTI